METDFGFRVRAYYCFVEWLTTCSNLDEYALKLHSDDRDAASSVETFFVNLLRRRVSSIFLFNLRGALRIDFPLSKFSLAISILISSFLELTLSAGETNIVVLEETILGEENSYPKSVLSKAAF